MATSTAPGLDAGAERATDGSLIYSVNGGRPRAQADSVHRSAMQINRERVARTIGTRIGQAYAGPLGGIIGGEVGARSDELLQQLQRAIDSPGRHGPALLAAANNLARRQGAGGLGGPASNADRRPRLS